MAVGATPSFPASTRMLRPSTPSDSTIVMAASSTRSLLSGATLRAYGTVAVCNSVQGGRLNELHERSLRRHLVRLPRWRAAARVPRVPAVEPVRRVRRVGEGLCDAVRGPARPQRRSELGLGSPPP